MFPHVEMSFYFIQRKGDAHTTVSYTHLELGKVQELEIIRTKEFGVYLAEKEGDEAAVLLPKKQVS